ncbi:DUF7832 domain-containing protein [Paenibacillus massiliensis]|uniref:DUF7832 domain-containing protein n=1 Tax=Paenibacillus massiliensis TaxID=225917 RepID=UPI0003F6D18E|nr:hypothetical protein [Paenibacillus massiliensis]
MSKHEIVLTKQGKSFKDYRHLAITEATEVCTLNIIKGRLYADRKTMNPVYEPYPTKQEAVARFNEVADEWRSKGYSEDSIDVIFQYKEKEVYVYDKAKWHLEGEFPQELNASQAYVPTGMFITWLIHHDLLEKRVQRADAKEIDLVKRGDMTGAEFFRVQWDGVLTSRELTDEADDFAREYLNIHNDVYTAEDFMNVLADSLPTIYHVEDSMENFNRIEPVISRRYQEWKLGRSQ